MPAAAPPPRPRRRLLVVAIAEVVRPFATAASAAEAARPGRPWGVMLTRRAQPLSAQARKGKGEQQWPKRRRAPVPRQDGFVVTALLNAGSSRILDEALAPNEGRPADACVDACYVFGQ